MGASEFEQRLAMTSGVSIHHMAAPVRILGSTHASAVEFENVVLGSKGELSGTGKTFSIEADVVFKAIGQRLKDEIVAGATLDVDRGKIVVDEQQATSVSGVWAGGDCVVGGDDLTVTAVQHGKVAAIAIDRHLRG